MIAGFATSIKRGCEESPRWLPVALIDNEFNEDPGRQPAIQFGRQIEYRFGGRHNRYNVIRYNYRITLLGPVRGSEAPCLGTPGERLAVLLWAV